ncbi:MAG: hypothetical protein WCB27_17550 [Thermoguttaceae bacterium]
MILAVSSRVMNRLRSGIEALIETSAKGLSGISRRRIAARKIIVANCSRFRTVMGASFLPIRCNL